MNSSIGRVECPIVKIVKGVRSPDLWFRFPDGVLRPARPGDREQERALLKGFDGMKGPLIQTSSTAPVTGCAAYHRSIHSTNDPTLSVTAITRRTRSL